LADMVTVVWVVSVHILENTHHQVAVFGKSLMHEAYFFVSPPQVRIGTSVVNDANGINEWPGNTWSIKMFESTV